MSPEKRHHRQERPDIFDPTFFSSPSACYNPERDGSLEKYLLTHDGMAAFPLFRGLDDYKLLCEGWLAPRISIIRLMWNTGRGDEHFMVTDDFRLQGIVHEHHGGPDGIHEPADVFTHAPPFEAQNLWGLAWQKMLDAEEERLRREMQK